MSDRADPDALFHALADRRSTVLGSLSPEPIDLGLVERMLEAANWAPSHGKTEPWRFVVFHGDARSRLSEAFGRAYCDLNAGPSHSPEAEAKYRHRVFQAPVWIALGQRPDPRRPEWEETVAFGCAVHNAQLMACALGLGVKWTSGVTAVHPRVAEVVGFEADTLLRGFLYVGEPRAPWPASRRGPLSEKVRWMGDT